jgi:hypothetical protein
MSMQVQSLIAKQEREKKEYEKRRVQQLQESDAIRRSCSDLSGAEWLDASDNYIGNMDVLLDSKKKYTDDFLPVEANLNEAYGKEENLVYCSEENRAEEISNATVNNFVKCQACMKSFTKQGSLDRHLERYPACVQWIELINLKLKNTVEANNIKAITPVISVRELIDNIYTQATSNDAYGILQQCKYCKTVFSSTFNMNKHFKTAISCNKLAINELKKMINDIEI